MHDMHARMSLTQLHPGIVSGLGVRNTSLQSQMGHLKDVASKVVHAKVTHR